MPGDLNKLENQVVSYRIKVLLPKTDETLVLEVPELPSSYNAFINGKLVIKNGTPSLIATQTVSGGGHQAIVLEKGLQLYEIVIQNSNNGHNAFGIWWSPKIVSFDSWASELKTKGYHPVLR